MFDDLLFLREDNGNLHREGASSSHRAVQSDGATHLLNDVVTDPEPESRSLPRGLGGEKGIEDFPLQFLGNTRAGIFDFDDQVVGRMLRGDV